MKYTLLICAAVLVLNLGAGRALAQQTGKGPDANGGFSGKVAEIMDAGDYTYVRVDTGKTNLWAAAPKFAAKIGDQAVVASGMAMPDYHSKTLNRDFPVVYFTDRVVINGAATSPGILGTTQDLPKGHPPIGGPTAGKQKIDLSGIKKAEGGKTIAEIYADKTQLSGKQVKVRGKVVKYNGNIMGKNWVHLRDGTGSEGSNDLLVTTTSEAKLGDTVLATGTVSLNKDFGANYKYSVMLDDARIVEE